MRPLPPLAGRRGEHARPGPRGVQAFRRVAAPVPRRQGEAEQEGPGLLPGTRRCAARGPHRARDHALPLGPAAGPPGPRRVGEPGHRVMVRRVRGMRVRRPGRQGAHVDHDQRALGGRVRGPRPGRARAGHPRFPHCRAGLPRPAPGPRPGRAGVPPGGRGRLAHRDHPGHAPRVSFHGRGLGRGGGPGRRRPAQPLVPAARAARQLPGGHDGAVRGKGGGAPHRDRRPGAARRLPGRIFSA